MIFANAFLDCINISLQIIVACIKSTECSIIRELNKSSIKGPNLLIISFPSAAHTIFLRCYCNDVRTNQISIAMNIRLPNRVRCCLNLVLTGLEKLLWFSVQPKPPFCSQYIQFTAFLAQHMPTNSSNCQELNLPISIDEVELAIARLNFDKAPRLDKIQGSYLTSWLLSHPCWTMGTYWAILSSITMHLKFLTDSTYQLIVTSQITLSSYGPLS